MGNAADTQALVWLRALEKELRDVRRNLEFCIRGQESGRLSQAQFDEFRDKVTRLAKKIVASTEGAYPGDE